MILAVGAAGCRGNADGGGFATGPDSSRVAREIGAMLQASASSWNTGDLDGFLDDYSDEPGLTFVGGGTVIRGRAEVRRRYLESYWAPGSRRDSLRFRDLEIRPLGPTHALAHGRYELYRPGDEVEVTGRGRFTLVLRLDDDRWSIVHDHSSPEPGRGEG